MKTSAKISGLVLMAMLICGLDATGQRAYGPPMRGNNMQGPGRGYGMRSVADSAARRDTLAFRHRMPAGNFGPRYGQMPRHFRGNAWGMPYGGRGMGPANQFGRGRGFGPVERGRFGNIDQGLGRIDLLPGLSDKQKKDIEALRKSQSAEMQKLRTEMQSKMQTMRDEHRKNILNLLTDEQKSMLGGFNTEKKNDNTK